MCEKNAFLKERVFLLYGFYVIFHQSFITGFVKNDFKLVAFDIFDASVAKAFVINAGADGDA